MQRLFDILFSTVALCVLLPILASIAFLLRLTGEGEVFYRQWRVGKNEEPFELLKFATMLKDSPNIGSGNITVKADPRVLPLGRILRKTKINELPQLLNVFVGDMSIVGPRPLTQDNYNLYSENAKTKIREVLPGLSGAGSIFFRNEELLFSDGADIKTIYADSIAPYKGALEIWYVDNQSISVYFKMIFVTVWVIFLPTSQISKTVFRDMPEPPKVLVESLGALKS